MDEMEDRGCLPLAVFVLRPEANGFLTSVVLAEDVWKWMAANSSRGQNRLVLEDMRRALDELEARYVTATPATVPSPLLPPEHKEQPEKDRSR